MNKYYIGVDAGATKTTACAYSTDGQTLQTATASFGNVTLDFVQGVKNIKQAIDEIIITQGVPIMVVLGISGVETGSLKEQVYNALQADFPNLYVTNDAMLGLYAALKGEDGILIIAGTGSIGYLKCGQELKRFGGWGHLINDDGSGYSIAIKAIRYIAYAFDNNNADTPLRKAIFSHLHITELRQLIDFTYKATKGEIAALVPIVVQTANAGDIQAVSILRWAGERLAFLAIGLCNQYNIQKPRIAISGSVIKKVNIVRKCFCDTLNCELDGYTLIDDDFTPAIGGYYIAVQKLKIEEC